MKTLLSESEIQDGVARLAAQVAADYAGRSVTILGVMTGSVVFLADLIRQLDMPLRVGVVQASSYRGQTTRGRLVIHADLMPEIEQRDVLLIDDIFDTGHTLAELRLHLERLGARSVRTAVLLLKEGRRQVELQPDYAVFTIPDMFVVGYGLDFRDAYRNLPYVAALDPADIESPVA